MRKVSRGPVGLSTYHVLASTALAVMLSACSSQVQRFSDNPSDSDPVYTSSVPPAAASPSVHSSYSPGANTDTISSRPLTGAAPKITSAPPSGYNYSSAYKAPTYNAPAYRAPTYNTGNAGQAAGNLVGNAQNSVNNSLNNTSAAAGNMANATVDNVNDTANSYTAPVRNAQQSYNKAATNLNTQAGNLNSQATQQVSAAASSVKVGPGMTLYSVARNNGVSVSELAAANNIKPPYSVSTGQVLRIPSGSSASHAAGAVAQDTDSVAPSTNKMSNSAGSSHKVANGETLFSLGRKYGVSPYAIADANGLPHDKSLIIGQTITIPGSGKVAVNQSKAPAAQNNDVTDSDDNQMAAKPSTPEAKNSLAAEELPGTPSSPTAAPATNPKLAATDSDPALVGLRWPVKGKIISDFGPKPNGLKNAGINIAVPEGTGIRAADSGVVAYAGNELKSYGNLVLIRHEGGWVTAYAHAKEIFVKKGDTVKRGEVIAKAGQTGSVSSPQLHFELRKGATAVDPMKYLNSATASN